MNEFLFSLGLLGLKGSLILLVVELLAARTRRASMRHLVWLLAVVALAALPLLQIALPALHFPVPGHWERAARTPLMSRAPADVTAPEAWPRRELPRPSQREAPSLRASSSSSSDALPTGSSSSSSEVSPPHRLASHSPVATSPATTTDHVGAVGWARPLQRAVFITYTAGVGVMALLSLLGSARLRRRAAAGKAIPGPVRSVADDICRRLEIERPVHVVTSDCCPMPHVIGLLHPVIVLPADSLAWPEGRLRHVLDHELAHVGRADVASGVLGTLVRIVYWPHPWVGRAVRNMRQAA